MSPTLILASASPRRRELLAASGVQFDIVPSTVTETPEACESPAAFAQRIAREKAWDVARRRPGACVLAADTVVIVGANLFGKPTDRDDARRMLHALSNRTHRVLTAVALLDGGGRIVETAVESEVDFRRVTSGEIEAYLDSGEPFDKAGAYAIQGLAQRFVSRVRGSYSNVIGLPMDEVLELLRRHCPWQMAAGARP